MDKKKSVEKGNQLLISYLDEFRLMLYRELCFYTARAEPVNSSVGLRDIDARTVESTVASITADQKIPAISRLELTAKAAHLLGHRNFGIFFILKLNIKLN